MRTLDQHKVNPVNDQITVTVIEAPTGEPVHYSLTFPQGMYRLDFQFGPINEVGINGITNEALLAIVLDRLNYFQKGKYACRENALAITNIEQGLMWLNQRTRERMKRQVEGTSQC
jgi:hypothetical protein